MKQLQASLPPDSISHITTPNDQLQNKYRQIIYKHVAANFVLAMGPRTVHFFLEIHCLVEAQKINKLPGTYGILILKIKRAVCQKRNNEQRNLSVK